MPFSEIIPDTESLVRKHGVCLYVRKGLQFVECSFDCPNAAAVHLLDFDIWILTIYRPPSYRDNQNDRLINLVSDFCSGREVVLFGDFYLPTFVWPFEGMLDRYVRPTDLAFLDYFTSLGLTQWVTESIFISSGSIIGLFFTSELDRVGSVEVLAPFPNCRHSPIVTDYVFYKDLDHEGRVDGGMKYLWHRGNYRAISEALAQFDWNREFAYRSVSDCFDHFVEILSHLTSLYVPLHSGANRTPWSVRPPCRMMRERSESWRRYKFLRQQLERFDALSLAALHEFKDVNRRYRGYALHSRCEYEQQSIDRSRDMPKLFHSYVRCKKKGRLSVGPLRLPSGELIDSSISMS